jgi:hypothetical protein
LPEQIFNADETALFYKKLPTPRTFVSTDKKRVFRFKAQKERVTLLLCSNYSGNHKVKPMMINRTLTQKHLKVWIKMQ